MATNYPTSADNNTTLPNPATSDTVANVSHAAQHANANDAIKAIEAKVGTGSSTPVANTLLFGTGTGTSAWTAVTSAQLAATLSDETGSGSAVFATTPTLVTPKVDTINEATGGNGTTIGGVNIKSGALNTNNSVPTAAIADSAVTSPKVAVGMVVQVVVTNFSAVATGSTVIPGDDTIPQSTEGDQYMTQAITPKATTNNLIIECLAFVSNTAAVSQYGSLFQDASANAVAAAVVRNTAASEQNMLVLRHSMAAGTTSSTTFKFRSGGDSAGTTTFNGFASARKFGGITLSTMTITEYKG